MKYLKKFENNTDYETYIDGSDTVTPNVSLVGHDEIHYNPYVNRLIARALQKLAELGYTEPYEGFGRIFVNVNREGYEDYTLTLAACAHKAENDDYGICLFAKQVKDAVAMMKVVMVTGDPRSPYRVLDSADWEFFQGATVDTLESDFKIVAVIDPGNDLSIFVGEEGIEI